MAGGFVKRYSLYLFLFSFLLLFVPGLVRSQVKLTVVNFQYHSSSEENFIKLQNKGKRTIQMKGWRLVDEKGDKYRFPKLKLKPKQIIKLLTGEGKNDKHGKVKKLYLGEIEFIWDEENSILILKNQKGKVILKIIYFSQEEKEEEPKETETAPEPEPTSPGIYYTSLTTSSSLSSEDEPVTFGLPLAKDLAINNTENLSIKDSFGNFVPAQFLVTARWSNGSIKWLLIDTQLDANQTYYLVPGSYSFDGGITHEETNDALIINTGASQFVLGKTDIDLLDVVLEDTEGNIYTNGEISEFEIEEMGPLRWGVKIHGEFNADFSDESYQSSTSNIVNFGWYNSSEITGDDEIEYTLRLYFYANKSFVRGFFTLENNNTCLINSSGQPTCQVIGSLNSIKFEDLSLKIETGVSGTEELMYQESSGLDSWNAFAGYEPRLQAYSQYWDEQKSGILSNGQVTVAIKDFWQNFPKALRSESDGTLEIALYPEEWSTYHTFRAGEHKTNEFLIDFSNSFGENFVHPLDVHAPSSYYAASGALGEFLPATDFEDNYEKENLATIKDGGLIDKLNELNFYGYLDYGDTPLDFEQDISLHNLKYDFNNGFLLQYLRYLDTEYADEWWQLADASNRHFGDIDITHSPYMNDHWMKNAAWGHVYHEYTNINDPHRGNGSPHPSLTFGVEGMLNYYYLTGYKKAYDDALLLADSIKWRADNDSTVGRGTGTGYFYTSCSGCETDKRSTGNGLNILIAAYKATGDEDYLETASLLIDDLDQGIDGGYLTSTAAGNYMIVWQTTYLLKGVAKYIKTLAEKDDPASKAKEEFQERIDFIKDNVILDNNPQGGFATTPYNWYWDRRSSNQTGNYSNLQLFLADDLAYAYEFFGQQEYLDYAEKIYQTGTTYPLSVDYPVGVYSSTKEATLHASNGLIAMYYLAE